jgi:hypothetical protein
MTPCIARDGRLALDACVGCDVKPNALLLELVDITGRAVGDRATPDGLADQLRDLVREVTAAEPRPT